MLNLLSECRINLCFILLLKKVFVKILVFVKVVLMVGMVGMEIKMPKKIISEKSINCEILLWRQ